MSGKEGALQRYILMYECIWIKCRGYKRTKLVKDVYGFINPVTHSDTPCGKEEKENEHYPCNLCVVLRGGFPCATFYRHRGI